MAKKDKADKERADKDKSEKAERKKAGKKKEPAAPGTLANAVTQVARGMRTRLSHGLAASGLYPGQDGVVQLLSLEDGLTPGALAQRLGVKAPTMTRTIGRMEAQGFVFRRADDRDARLTKVYLTEEGRSTVERIAGATTECEQEAVRGLSNKELRTLVKLLAIVDGNLSGKTSLSRSATDLDEDD
ncbi:MarR family transcriptional regulator [Rhizobium sp. Root274]|uniref:MarR family winged helix-turn-helix transcriptional regulator n=1 Tax=unclassified Rhizobium TaxID=2613769 RepID=UPI000714B635|nr:MULTISPECIES: MarR family transcriptional regulator [unclassified Rhizobium]KQW29378.1 MarR family transcriptional regulator [Rhizobium sp. Root1240]KRD29571.1 MarR family transcriptional regulator [Rhizobium sp. Root274]